MLFRHGEVSMPLCYAVLYLLLLPLRPRPLLELQVSRNCRSTKIEPCSPPDRV